jgi:hypothetical protein
MVLFQSPMRCRTCRTRFFVALSAAARFRKEARERRNVVDGTGKAAFD